MEFNGDVHSIARPGPQPNQPACRQLKHMDWAFNRTGPGGRRCDVIWTHSANRPAKGTNPVEKLVPTTGLEPVRCYSLEPESSASANSATWALRQFKSSGRMIRHAAAYLAPPVGAEQAKTKSPSPRTALQGGRIFSSWLSLAGARGTHGQRIDRTRCV